MLSAIPLGAKEDEKMDEDRCAIRLTTQERQFLNHIWTHPTFTVTQRYSSLALSSRGGTGVQKSLQTKQLVVPLSISVGRGRIKILSLTDKGKAILGIAEPDADRLGGPEHRYWKRRLTEHLRGNGYEVVEEFAVGGGKTIDLVATKGDKRIAFEIETGKSDAAGNVKKCVDAGMDDVVVVATSARVREMLTRSLSLRSGVEILDGSGAVQRKDG
jgi:DNA-binding MarR family transcriptional regulator